MPLPSFKSSRKGSKQSRRMKAALAKLVLLSVGFVGLFMGITEFLMAQNNAREKANSSSRAATIRFENEVLKTTTPDGKGFIYEFKVPQDAGREDEFKSLKLRIENGKLTAYQLERKQKENKKLRGNLLIRRDVDLDYSKTEAALQLVSSDRKGQVATSVPANSKTFILKDSSTFVSRLEDLKISSVEEDEIRKSWDPYYFGVDSLAESPTLFQQGDRSAKISLQDATNEILNASYLDHNRFALSDLQEIARRIADRGEFYGDESSIANLKLVFENFGSLPDPNNPGQNFPMVDALQKRVVEGVSNDEAPGASREFANQNAKKQR